MILLCIAGQTVDEDCGENGPTDSQTTEGEGHDSALYWKARSRDKDISSAELRGNR